MRFVDFVCDDPDLGTYEPNKYDGTKVCVGYKWWGSAPGSQPAKMVEPVFYDWDKELEAPKWRAGSRAVPSALKDAITTVPGDWVPIEPSTMSHRPEYSFEQKLYHYPAFLDAINNVTAKLNQSLDSRRAGLASLRSKRETCQQAVKSYLEVPPKKLTRALIDAAHALSVAETEQGIPDLATFANEAREYGYAVQNRSSGAVKETETVLGIAHESQALSKEEKLLIEALQYVASADLASGENRSMRYLAKWSPGVGNEEKWGELVLKSVDLGKTVVAIRHHIEELTEISNSEKELPWPKLLAHYAQKYSVSPASLGLETDATRNQDPFSSPPHEVDSMQEIANLGASIVQSQTDRFHLISPNNRVIKIRGDRPVSIGCPPLLVLQRSADQPESIVIVSGPKTLRSRFDTVGVIDPDWALDWAIDEAEIDQIAPSYLDRIVDSARTDVTRPKLPRKAEALQTAVKDFHTFYKERLNEINQAYLTAKGDAEVFDLDVDKMQCYASRKLNRDRLNTLAHMFRNELHASVAEFEQSLLDEAHLTLQDRLNPQEQDEWKGMLKPLQRAMLEEEQSIAAAMMYAADSSQKDTARAKNSRIAAHRFAEMSRDIPTYTGPTQYSAWLQMCQERRAKLARVTLDSEQGSAVTGSGSRSSEPKNKTSKSKRGAKTRPPAQTSDDTAQDDEEDEDDDDSVVDENDLFSLLSLGPQSKPKGTSQSGSAQGDKKGYANPSRSALGNADQEMLKSRRDLRFGLKYFRNKLPPNPHVHELPPLNGGLTRNMDPEGDSTDKPMDPRLFASTRNQVISVGKVILRAPASQDTNASKVEMEDPSAFWRRLGRDPSDMETGTEEETES